MSGLFFKYRFLFFINIVLLLLISSCAPTSEFLNDDESLLVKNEVKLNPSFDLENKYRFTSKLAKLIIQEPNSNFMGIPREFIYYKNTQPGDTMWNNRFLANYLGEKPSIVSEKATKQSALAIQNYLINKKGFYNAKVSYDLEKEYKMPIVKFHEDEFSQQGYYLDTVYTSETKVIYNVDPGERYKINSITYLAKQKEIKEFIESIKEEAIIKKGDYIDANEFNLELTRMSLALQNEGYANFATNFFNIQGDSALQTHSVDIFLEVRPPLPDTVHQKFSIGAVNVFTDFHADQRMSLLESDTFNHATYFRQAEFFLVKPSVIDNSIFLKPGTPYNRQARSNTRKKLSRLGTYRFVSLSAKRDEVVDSIINYDIILTPFQKKFVVDFGWDFFVSSTNASQNNSSTQFGFSLNNQIKDRNFLGGAEQFILDSEVGLEIQLDTISTNSLVRSRSLGLNAVMEIPRHRNLLGFTTFLRTLGLMNADAYQQFKDNTTTKVGLGYNYNNLVNNYNRSSINANYSFDFRPNEKTRFLIRQLAFDYNDYTLFPFFEERIVDNPLLLRSFDDNLLTGLFFRDITYLYSTATKIKGASYTFISKFEVSGWEKYLLNRVYNLASGNTTEWRLNKTIEFSKFFRLEADGRFYENFSERQSLATRLFAGIIVPFGGSKAAPYFKQFSVGGPNSLRGWDQKELGPGEYSELLLNPIPNQNFFQTGDIKLEANVEYRFDLFYIFEGAFFVDAGNVWTLKENSDRPGSQLTTRFYDQIAVSAGYGIRFDFSYFNIRFDFGYKLRNPYVFENTKRHWYNWEDIKNQKFGNFQVAVNYPF